MGRTEIFELPVPFAESPRKIYVYLPNGYDETKRKYPVLYMFDGHNLFSDETATYGKSWGMKEYLDANDVPLVVVGQDCSHVGHGRLSEYCPVSVKDSEWFPDIETCGKVTADWFVNVLKKECEQRYRIYRNRHRTGIGGSSMGGLMALYCVIAHNRVFSRAAAVSPSMDLNMPELLELIGNTQIDPDTKIYFDFGSDEVKRRTSLVRCVDNLLALSHACSEAGADVWPHLNVNGMHNEASWEKLIPLFIPWLFQ